MMNNIDQAFSLPDFIDPENLLSTAPHLSVTTQANAQVIVPTTLLKKEASEQAETVSSLLYGEPVLMREEQNGWCYVSGVIDGYCGWIPGTAIREQVISPTHQVAVPFSHIYSEANLKSAPLTAIPMGAFISVTGKQENKFKQLENGGWIYAAHLAAVGNYTNDPVAIALSFLGSPYLWGGRSRAGIDCSGLIQISLAACGVRTHRDSGPQFASLGSLLGTGDTPRHGDLVFFPGHVGWMLDDTRLLHANATHMAVTIDPLEDVIRWVESETNKPPFSGFRRLSV